MPISLNLSNDDENQCASRWLASVQWHFSPVRIDVYERVEGAGELRDSPHINAFNANQYLKGKLWLEEKCEAVYLQREIYRSQETRRRLVVLCDGESLFGWNDCNQWCSRQPKQVPKDTHRSSLSSSYWHEVPSSSHFLSSLFPLGNREPWQPSQPK